ncbi:hypothetical protein [Kitasatospora albolonga]|uniref:hypothetical protein n=1 Tax=Kitasatospora albolonga TaxID=68173 RepID=UPI0035E56B86
MLRIRPVIEHRPHLLEDFTAWPVEAGPLSPLDDDLVVLDGTLTPAQVGAVVALLAGYNHLRVEEDAGPLDALLGEEPFRASGGLLTEDSRTGLVMGPSCCSDLDGWRSWYEVGRSAEIPWTVHGTDAVLRLDGPSVRFVPLERAVGRAVTEVPLAELPSLLAGVERDLAAFLVLLGDWARRTVPERAEELVRAFGRSLRIPEEAEPWAAS